MAATEGRGKGRASGSGDGSRREAAFAAPRRCCRSPRVALGFRRLPGAAPRQELVPPLTQLLEGDGTALSLC